MLSHQVAVQVVRKVHCTGELKFFFVRWGSEGSTIPNGLIYEGVSPLPRKVCRTFPGKLVDL